MECESQRVAKKNTCKAIYNEATVPSGKRLQKTNHHGNMGKFTNCFYGDFMVMFHGFLYVYQRLWEFQDPIMEVLHHIRPYFGGIFTYIGLKNRPYIW